MQTAVYTQVDNGFKVTYMKYWYDKNFGGIMCEPNSADEWLELIWEVVFDYDGRNKDKELKDLVDELVDMALKAKNCLRDGKLFEDEEESFRSLNAAKIERDRGDINA